ncbi:hypothetical protein NDR87_10055 [Nocardia sp. CDC159]|uniref:Transcriptional regulator, AbiEi antitoxin, Type IV TA system n=1 Tax=Nocardia pulmonis TaxID=2951408 RepID=A0A9X2E543_9NOCA|nr:MULTISPECIES: hypothetical protein [Nocardia]MCM6773810.1 hypothetical protein [Nocardia pulmonis]MCM6786697.1 hypothetical protein [Nocardia sp. CDC159]
MSVHGPRAPIHRRHEVLRRGFSDNEIRRRHRGQRWHRIRRGTYVKNAAFVDLDVIERHRLLIDAVLPDMADQTVLSHQSAALVYGCPLWQTPLDRVCVTRDRRHGGRIKPDVKMHCAPVDQVAIVDGYQLTTPARTVVDLARTLSRESAVVAGDALVGAFGIEGAELAMELERAKFRHGIAHAKRVLARLDGRSESVGESRSRLMLERLGLPQPRSQGNVFDPAGKFVGRVDFYYEKAAVLCEFDGRIKYGRLLQPGQTPGDAVYQEKIREDALRALGFQVIRWTWEDLTDPDPDLTPRLHAALSRARTPTQGRLDPACPRTPRPLTLRPL